MAPVPKALASRLGGRLPSFILLAAILPLAFCWEDVDECTLLQTSTRTASSVASSVLGSPRKTASDREVDAAAAHSGDLGEGVVEGPSGGGPEVKVRTFHFLSDLAKHLMPKRLVLLSQAQSKPEIDFDALPVTAMILILFIFAFVVALFIVLLQCAFGTGGGAAVDKQTYPLKHMQPNDVQHPPPYPLKHAQPNDLQHMPPTACAGSTPTHGQSVQFGMLQAAHVPSALVAALPPPLPTYEFPPQGRALARSTSPAREVQTREVFGARSMSPPRTAPAPAAAPLIPMVQPVFRGGPDLSASMPAAHSPGRPPRMPMSQSMPPQVFAPPSPPPADNLEFALPSLKGGTAGAEQLQCRVLDAARNPCFLAVLGAPSDRNVEFIALSEYGGDRRPVGLCELWLPREQECSGPRCSILAPGGVPFATIEQEPLHGIAGHQSFVASADEGGHMLLRIQGRSGSRSHRVESNERVMAAIVEPGFDKDGVEYYWLKAAPGTDAGLCVLALLALDRLQHYV